MGDKIRALQSSVKDGSEELETLRNEAETILKDARTEAKIKIVEAKTKLNNKAEAELAAAKSKLNHEVEQAIKELELNKDAEEKGIDQQAAELSKSIINCVLPSGFTL